MKTKILILISILSLISFIAVAADWTLYGTVEGTEYYYVKDSIAIETIFINVWTKTKYSESKKEEIISNRKRNKLPVAGYSNLDYTVQHLQLNCRFRNISILSSTDYSKDGAVLESTKSPPSRTSIYPENISESLLNEICK